MQYMCLIYKTEGKGPQPGTDEFAGYIQAYHEFSAHIKDKGVFCAGDALQPTVTATTVTTQNGKTETMDGPFAETKEQLGGYYIIDCDDLDEALKYAAMIPSAKYGRIEVRPVMIFD
jgi:hypothetical protein